MPSQLIEAAPPSEALGLLGSAGAMFKGHFLLSSGLHSQEYFQCAKLLEQSAVAEQIARALAGVCGEWKPDTVLSPALGGILIGYELSRALGVRNIFAERPSGAFELRRGFSLEPGERVLLAENVVTTGGSVEEVARMARSLGAVVAGYAVIVDRSSGRFAPDEPVAAYVKADAVTYQPDACPLCVQGKPIEKPGSRALPG
jgi:orotate phosphoribosyltransferase